MMDFGRYFGARKRQGEIQGELPPGFQELLDAASRRLRAVDPDTKRQWQYLNVVVQRSSASEKAGKPARAFRLLSPAFSYGSILVIVLAIAGVIWLNRSSVLTYETGKGQQSSIMLSDSSEVTLNHTSTLIVESRPFGGTRHVSLKGEAFFHVRRNGAPFIVTTDLGSVQVLGTQFDVHMRGEQLMVGVLTGTVEVSAQRGGRDSAVVLKAGQILTCSKEGFPGTPADLPFADYPGWVQGKILFYRTSLLLACREIEARFDVRIRFGDPRIGSETITGVVDGRSAETAVMALSNLTGNKFRHENNIYTLY
jgi:ferric-dicitrate binding protein FerR (iron transport regulator)